MFLSQIKIPHDSSSSEKGGLKVADLYSILGKVLVPIEENDAYYIIYIIIMSFHHLLMIVKFVLTREHDKKITKKAGDFCL